jgi:hypothetical protein
MRPLREPAQSKWPDSSRHPAIALYLDAAYSVVYLNSGIAFSSSAVPLITA